MTPTVVFFGVPDDGKIEVKGISQGNLAFTYPGIGRIAVDLPETFKRPLKRAWCGPGIPIQVPPELERQPCINAIADADISSLALRMLEAHVQAKRLACFNRPAAVLATTRDQVASRLATVDGLLVPPTLRLRIQEPQGIVRAASQHGLHWPLIVRCAGSHRGHSMVRIDDPRQVREALGSIPWGGRNLYLTEYVDCQDVDGHYRKMRLAMIGDRVFIRHLLIADHWMVHAGDRKPGHLEEEAQILHDFHETLLPRLSARLDRIRAIIDMDYFGIDCNLRPDGRLQIFEVNSLMDIMLNTQPSPNIWDAPIAMIKQALLELLQDPRRWRHPQADGARG